MATPNATSGDSAAITSAPKFYRYRKDLAGNFSEFYPDMDCSIDDQL
jgi:hypothetical protein